MPKSTKIEGVPNETTEENADAPYQMPLKMTAGDRRVLVERAKASGMSPTKWLISQIHAGSENGLPRTSRGISFKVDRLRLQSAEVLAQKLGFDDSAELARDLLYRALEDPEEVESFLFDGIDPQGKTAVERAKFYDEEALVEPEQE